MTTSPGAIIRMSVEGADTSQRQIDAVASSMNRLSETVQSAMTKLASTVGIGGGLVQVIALSDEYAKFTSQLKLATESQREYAIAYGDVKRISKEAQSDLAGTGVLYARIANGTRELGASQARVAAITEVVNLSLKVSAATTAEAASAQLQLSQAFASGTLRGEEFNAVNEAAPRLMKALADGMGVPIGALKQMASDGKITSEVMARVLPNALQALREEAKQVQTIGGAFTVLKNNVMEFTAITAQSNGTVSILTGGLSMLADNLVVVVGALTTMTAVKIGTWLSGAVVKAYENAAANRVLATTTLAAAQAEVAATGAASALAAARVVELRAAVLAAEGEVALAITTNGLIPAQASAAAAAEAHALALTSQTVALRAASVAGGVLRAALAFLGGPIGLVITALGIAATAWAVWGQSAKDANAQTTEAVDESTTEMIARLDKQIAKLIERNKLLNVKPELKGVNQADIDGLARAYTELNDVRNGTGKFAGDSVSVRQIAEIDVLARYNTALARTTTAHELVTEAATGTRNVQIKKWFDENGTQAQKMTAELDKLRAQFGTIPPEMEKMVRVRFADKGAATTIRQEETAYTSLVTAIGEKIAAGKLELAGGDKLTEAQKLTIKLDEAIMSGKNKLTPAHIAEARAMIETVAAQDKAVERSKAMAKIQSDYADKLGETVAIATKEALANETLASTYGMTKMAIELLTIARMEDRLEKLRGIDGADDEVAALELVIAAKKRNAVALGKLDGLEAANKAGEDLLKFLDPTKAQTFGEALKGAFGAAGDSLGQLTSALQVYGIHQAEIEKARKDAAVKYAGDAKGLAVVSAQISRKEDQDRIGSYADMTGAAKGFFKEGSKGYGALAVAEKTFRAIETAMAVQTMLTKSGLLTGFTSLFVASKATETAATIASVAPDVAASMAKGTAAAAVGVAGQAQGDPYTAWPRMAAMAAAMAALGFMVAGAGGGSGGGQTAAEVQKTQGTGSVLGDSSAKSESIAHAIALASANSSIELTHTAGMLASLKNIESSMSGLTNLIARTSGVTDGSNLGIETGQINKGAPTDFISTVASGLTKALFGPGIGDKIAGFINNLWGKTTQNIVDSGFQLGGSVRALQAGQGYSQYASVDTTKSSWFGLSKSTSNSVQTQGLTDELSSQFGLIFTNLEGALKAAAVGLGVDAAQVTKALDNLTIDTTKISLKDLTGDALTQAVNGVLSKTMDEMAQAAFPAFDAFRHVGEGYAETVVRVATDYANLDSILQGAGMTFGAVGTSSIGMREKLIDLAGGIDKLAGQTTAFANDFLTEAARTAPLAKYVKDEMAALGYATVDTRDKFADLVLGIDKTTPAGQQLFVSLMALESAFAKTHAAAVDLTLSEQAIADQRKDLQTKWDDLTMTTAQLHAKERATIDPLNLALYDQVSLQQDLKASTLAASDALSSTIERLTSAKASTIAYRDSLLLGSLSTLTPMQKYLETQRQYAVALDKARAKPDDTSAQSAAQTAATAFLSASQVIYASSAAFVGDRSKVLTDMTSLADIAGTQISDAQKQLGLATEQVTGIATLNSTALGIQQAIVDLGATGGVSPASFDMARYTAAASAGNDALVAEIKALRAQVNDLLVEAKGRRADAVHQSDDQVAATENTGGVVAGVVSEAVTKVGWAANNPTRQPAR